MNGEILRLLDKTAVARIVDALGRTKFVDGKFSAKGNAAAVKHNLQMDPAAERTGCDQILVSALAAHVDFQEYALPSRLTVPHYSRYEPGMCYGDHIDQGLMGGNNGLRSDLAMTVFLSPPASYDGGELVIAGRDEVKLDSGEAFIYPATTIHHVAPVTRGIRLAAVFWIQSAVRDERIRGVLWDLSLSLRKADLFKDQDLSNLLLKSYHNLLRYAAQP